MTPRSSNASRREFLKSSAATAGAVALSTAVHAAGSDVLKIGLVGCGGRGTGAATQALSADPNVKLIALGDMFADRLENSLHTLRRDPGIASKVDVKSENCFTGFDAYKQVLASGIDVVLLATPPGFRPLHLRAAVEAGKHIFAEKPMAVDGPGVRAVLAAAGEAKRRNLALVAGFCWRYHNGMREAFKRVHDGVIGDITALQCTYNTGPLWHRKKEPGLSDMEWQLRNWLYFTWLSGDFIVEQHCHSLDKMAWAMRNEYPVKAVGVGGRQVRTGPEFGHIFDHFSITYEFANGVKLFSQCRQQGNCAGDVSDHVFGTRGTLDTDGGSGNALIRPHGGGSPWRYRAGQHPSDAMYQSEHNELFASIRNGKPINDGEWMARSSLMAIMGRTAAYTGQVITLEKMLNSKEDLSPPKYEFGALPVPPVAQPGVTKFA